MYRLVMSYFLTLKEFGVLSASLPYQSFVLLFTSMSITPTVSKFTSEYRIHEKEKIFNVFSLLLMGFLMGGVLYLLTGILTQFFGAEFSGSESLLKILAAGVPFAVLLSICTGVFLGFERSELMAVFLFVYQVLMILFSYFLVKYTGLHGAAQGILLGYAVTGVAAFVVVLKFRTSVTFTVQDIIDIFKGKIYRVCSVYYPHNLSPLGIENNFKGLYCIDHILITLFIFKLLIKGLDQVPYLFFTHHF